MKSRIYRPTLWITYFRNIFNPARLKVKAMQSAMPKKYWKNLPEAVFIPEMIAGAPARARTMADAAPTLPPARMAQVQAQLAGHHSAWEGPKEGLNAAIASCTRCPLHCHATQAVCGEGPPDADLMIVGEQPGDQEDLSGRPFVGPAGQLFDQIAQQAGLERSHVYVTNAVKHFKFTPQGRRRIHQRPNSSEIDHCRWWLDAEVSIVKPKLVVAMGATALESLTGRTAQARRDRDGTWWPAGTRHAASFLYFAPARQRRTRTGPRAVERGSGQGGQVCSNCSFGLARWQAHRTVKADRGPVQKTVGDDLSR
jgi:uracil-DNA glycosylase family protein